MRQMTKRVMCFLIAVAVTMGLSAGTIVYADEIAATISDADFGTIPSDYTFEDYIINPVITNTGTEKLDLTGVDIKVELTDGDPSAFLCGWKSVGGYLLPGDTATNAWIIVKEGLPTGVTTSTLTLSYKVNGSWKVLATSKVSVRVNPAEYGFTSFPKSGTCEKTSEYSFSWGLKKEPDYIVLQRKDSDGAWGNLNDLKGKTSFSVKYLGHETDTYRIIVISNSETFCSNEFTVIWIDPLTYEATLENLGFGSKVVGYSDISSVIFRIDITGTGNLICDSDHYNILFTGDTSAFEWWVAPGSTMFSGNMYNAGTVKPVKGLSKGSYKLTAHLYYDQDGTGTAYGWKELDTADYTFKVTAATPTPTKKPTATPTKKPTVTPTKKPTSTPTKKPTATPTPYISGWVQLGDEWFYYDGSGQKVTGWYKIGAWYYFDEDGVMQTGWQEIDGEWYYLRPSGSMYTGWLPWGNTYYYLDSSGKMVTGWKKIDGTWYYFLGSGAMVKGWKQIDGTWYYLESDGAMHIGWLLSGGNWYYLDTHGAMVTGWLHSGNYWYYFKDSGSMLTGWLEENGKYYYLDDDGRMVTGTVKIDGKRYTFDSHGVCTNR